MCSQVEKYIEIITRILLSKCPEDCKNNVIKNYIILANAVLADEKHQHYKGWRPRLVMNANGFIEVEHVIYNGIPFLDFVHYGEQQCVDISSESQEQFEIFCQTNTEQLPSAEEIDATFQ